MTNRHVSSEGYRTIFRKKLHISFSNKSALQVLYDMYGAYLNKLLIIRHNIFPNYSHVVLAFHLPRLPQKSCVSCSASYLSLIKLLSPTSDGGSFVPHLQGPGFPTTKRGRDGHVVRDHAVVSKVLRQGLCQGGLPVKAYPGSSPPDGFFYRVLSDICLVF